MKVRGGAATAVGGIAHVGTNEPARQDAVVRFAKVAGRDAVSFGTGSLTAQAGPL